MTRPPWLAVASRFLAFGPLVLAVTLVACRKRSEEGGLAEGATSAAASAPAPPQAGAFVAATRRACRVMALRGSAMATPPAPEPARPLARGDLLPEGALIELGSGAELTVQATVSTREITLVGPATAEACPGGEEAVRLSRGKVTAFPGAGVRPGAEVWVATPLGVVQFNNAKMEIDVAAPDADRLRVTMAVGQGAFVPAVGVRVAYGPFERRADASGRGAPAASGSGGSAADGAGDAIALAPGGHLDASRPAVAPLRWARDLVAACVRQGTAAFAAGQRIAAAQGGGRESLGDLAFAQVRARQRARAACEAARAAGGLAPGLLDAALRGDLAGAEEKWRATPSPPADAPSRPAPDAD